MSAIDSHTAGEPTRVITGGLPPLTGVTLAEKQASLYASWPDLIGMVVGEPRGHAPSHATVVLPPTRPDADLSLLILSALGPLEMCGHALIGTVTTLLETGLYQSPTLRIETLAGLITAHATVHDGEVTHVRFQGAPSYVEHDNLPVDVPGFGVVPVSLVYGGLWYAVVDVAAIGMTIHLDHVNALVTAGSRIRAALPRRVPQTLFVADGLVNMATSDELGFDRSPCGTGTCARLALMHARGELAPGESREFTSITGTRFTGRIASATDDRVHPEISGSAWLTARTTLLFSPTDPLRAGFFVPAVDRASVPGTGRLSGPGPGMRLA
ncbi:proline racemase family protein [Actinoplanes sp. LDG1-06]|uniref:Proline racemase family protein n=1 Tax=Paractinoplanes ovalisporus TaxID=2810368 RepID=A0ABS2A767_9ACTN|nr:proline racemase family protein [Actinoplanes ovalisporus]MBM2615682.1 proline racemase family protein [Actinoplanes ovalisporus]